MKLRNGRFRSIWRVRRKKKKEYGRERQFRCIRTKCEEQDPKLCLMKSRALDEILVISE